MQKIPPPEVFNRLRDKRRAVIVLKKPSAEARAQIVALAKQRGLVAERFFEHTSTGPLGVTSQQGGQSVRIQQDVTISLDGVPIDPDGRVVLRQEFALDLKHPKPRVAVSQTDHVIWLKGDQAFEHAREIVGCLNLEAAASPAWRLPVARRKPQRHAVFPFAADVRIVQESPEILTRLEKFGKLDRCPQFGGNWYELTFHTPPEDFYEFARTFVESFDCNVELGYRVVTLATPVAVGPPNEERYPLQRRALEHIGAVAMWALFPGTAAAVAAMHQTVIFLIDIGVYAGTDAPAQRPLCATTIGTSGPLTGGADPTPPASAPHRTHGTKMTGIMGAHWTAPPTAGTGIAGVAGFCPAVVKVGSVTTLYLTDIARGLDFAVTRLTEPDIPAGTKGVVVIGYDVLQMSLEECGCSDERRRFNDALVNAVKHDLLVIVPAGNCVGSTDCDIPDVLPAEALSGTVIVGASGDPNGVQRDLRWNDSAGASRMGNGPGTVDPDLVAPGRMIQVVTDARPGSTAYGLADGTSCAAAHVAGVAALMRAVGAVAMPASEIKNRLLASVRVLTPPPAEVGAGMLNAAGAIAAAQAPYP